MNPTPLHLRRLLPLPLSKRCIHHTRHHTQPHHLPLHYMQSRHFHPSRRKASDVFPNHYETLELPSSASPAEIKKQFYALSKKYHPDVNHSASASERFVKISEAYHILGSAEKKGKYDRDLHRAHATHGRHGSHHSRSGGPAGGRPASGLSKRRSQFRGPPPSFYAQGGYGSQGGKRQRAQSEADARHDSSTFSNDANAQREGGLGSRPSYAGSGGYSPGSSDSAYFDPDPSMPYFDKASHRRTHDNLGARREAYAERARSSVDPAQEVRGPGLLANFVIVSTVVAVATVAASAVLEFVRGGPGQGRRDGGGVVRRRPDG